MSSKKGSRPRASLARFVFRATGGAEGPSGISPLDLRDNLSAEIDRLFALADLLLCAGDRLDPGRLGSVAELLRDVADRMAEILKRADAAGRG